jgi:hypothetical protein
MNKLILSAVTAAVLGGLSLTASAVSAAPANPAPIVRQSDTGIVQVASRRERMMMRHEMKKRHMMHRRMHMKRRMMHNM